MLYEDRLQEDQGRDHCHDQVRDDGGRGKKWSGSGYAREIQSTEFLGPGGGM